MILTIGPGGCGFTFLNWTISYLRGDIFYTNLNGEQNPVDIDPLDGSTAHNFRKDHLKIEHSKDRLRHATEQSIVYLTPGSQQDFLQLLALPGKKVIYDNLVNTKELLARSCLTMPRCRENIMVLVDHLSGKYGAAARAVFLECDRLFVQYYQLPSQAQHAHYPISYLDVFQHLDRKLQDLFAFLEIAIDKNRLSNWHRIYQIYRGQNQNYIERFLGPESMAIDAGTKKAILKDILHWQNGQHHLININ